MSAARPPLTPEEKREKNRKRQKRWYARQHPNQRKKIAPVEYCAATERFLYALQAVDKPEGNTRKHVGDGITRLLKISMKNS